MKTESLTIGQTFAKEEALNLKGTKVLSDASEQLGEIALKKGKKTLWLLCTDYANGIFTLDNITE